MHKTNECQKLKNEIEMHFETPGFQIHNLPKGAFLVFDLLNKLVNRQLDRCIPIPYARIWNFN